MLRALLAALLALWELGPAAAALSQQHLRYQRQIVLPASASGQACVALDAQVFAHTESAGAGDIRIYGRDRQDEFEVPFALTESGSATLDTQRATVGNISVDDGKLMFDLSMPASEYTEVDLDLNAKNFYGAAQVAAVDSHGRRTPLGIFPVFDLSAQGLARSTVLPLPPSTYPLLHIELRLLDLDGHPLAVSPSILGGASVPPSREDQTAYTTIASTSAIEQQGHWSAAAMIVPPHVPVERARFVPRPDFRADFLRNATIAATPMEKGWEATGAAEGVSGEIFRVRRDSIAGIPAIDTEALTINTVIGANLRSPAKITATIDNETSPPLPIEHVELQMRERKLCFSARAGASYTLRYGDAELSAPSYKYARRFVAATAPVLATLGPEQRNSHYAPTALDAAQRNPGRDLPWVLLIAGISIVGVTALQYIRHKREGTG